MSAAVVLALVLADVDGKAENDGEKDDEYGGEDDEEEGGVGVEESCDRGASGADLAAKLDDDGDGGAPGRHPGVFGYDNHVSDGAVQVAERKMNTICLL